MPIQILSNRRLELCGVQRDFRPGENGELCLVDGGGLGIFVSRVYDSGEKGTQWNRLILDISANVTIRVCVWLADEMREDTWSDTEELFDYVEGNAQYTSNYREMLLYGKGCGRYARLALKIFSGEGAGERVFYGYSLTFPKESFTRYLPSIYQDNRQLERFLAVQESIYLELERNIDAFAEDLDYELCSQKHLVRLAGWMGWGGLAELVSEDVLRRLLGRGTSLASRKGTCSYYTELTEILTGKRASVIEEPESRRATVLIWGRPAEGWEGRLEWLKKNVSIGIRMDFIVVHKTDQLDGQCFLGVTSYLGEKESELAEGGVDIDSLRLL